MAHSLKVDDVSFRFPRGKDFIFKNVTFAASSGDVVGIAAKNGSGKTTLLRVVGGLYEPASGRVTLEDEPVAAVANRVAFVEAEFDMFSYLTVEGNIRFFLDFYEVDYGESDLERLLDRYRLAPERGTSAQAASRGMRKKMQIVTALLQRPRLLLADEPFDGLDIEAQEAFIEDLAAFRGDGGITLIVLHDEEREAALTTTQVRLSTRELVVAKP
jgi:ABC-type multidrug transport system ATPase subunit